ncbi:hypothetical protein H7H51_03415 [Mycolicibacterium farcinogenes]|nr:hypothetical protein [Mycolicibacterium farcinogenes]
MVALLALGFIAGAVLEHCTNLIRPLHIPTDPKGPNWAEILMLVLTLALLGVGGLALSSVKEARSARNGQYMTELSRRWDEAPNREVRRDVQRYATDGLNGFEHTVEPGPRRLREAVLELRKRNDSAYRTLLTDPSYLEDIAIMVYHGQMDFDLVNESLGFHVPYRWSLWKPTIEALRDMDEAPTRFECFQRLAKDIAKKDPKTSRRGADGEIEWRGFRE